MTFILSKFLGKLTLKQLILLKLVEFPMVTRYNPYVGGALVAFEVTHKGSLMIEMNIFTVRLKQTVS